MDNEFSFCFTARFGGGIENSFYISFVERRWGNAYKRFAAVIVVGGGALLLRNSLVARFNARAWVPDDPVVATARGLYKLAAMTAARRRS